MYWCYIWVWQTGRQIDRWVNRLGGRQTDKQTETETDQQTDRQTDKQTDRQTGKQADRQAHKQTDRQAGKQTDRQTDRQTHSDPLSYHIQHIDYPVHQKLSIYSYETRQIVNNYNNTIVVITVMYIHVSDWVFNRQSFVGRYVWSIPFY